MAGPTAGVLLPKALGATEVADLRATLESIGSTKPYLAGNECLVVDTSSIGGSYIGEGCPFLWCLQEPQMEPGWPEILRREFGFEPRQELDFAAMYNSSVDHQILDTLVLHFAAIHCGVVDFGGALMVPAWSSVDERQWEDVSQAVELRTRACPGKLVALPYLTISDTTWATHVGNAEFVRAWLLHPDFGMIK